MKIGVVYPQTELSGNPEALLRIALATEALGYNHLLMYDHVVGASPEKRDPPLWGPYTDKDPFHDPFVAFGYLAAATRTLELATGVLILPQRQTALVAQQAADVDLLSGERLRLGVGSGWNYVEYQALGQDFHTRGRRLSEQIRLLRQLWMEPLVTFEGEFDRIERANINPRPRRAIPIWLGGFSEAAFRRGAVMGDGFIFAGAPGSRVNTRTSSSVAEAGNSPHVPSVLNAWQRVQGLLVEAGRNIEGFGADLVLVSARGVDDVVAQAHQWQDAGGTHASFMTAGLGFTRLEQHLDYIAAVKDGLGNG